MGESTPASARRQLTAIAQQRSEISLLFRLRGPDTTGTLCINTCQLMTSHSGISLGANALGRLPQVKGPEARVAA